MIQLDGIEYSIKSAEENANDAVGAVNEYCNANNVRTRNDELVQVDANYANPLYILFLGVGYLVTKLQNLIYSAGCALSLTASSERQLLNIADIAGVRRRRQTKTTVIATVYSNLAGEDAVACQITTALSVTVNAGSETVVLHPAFDITVPVGSSLTIVLVAETYGSYSISANVITSFDTNPAGFRSMTSDASVPGQEQETVRALRERIQRRATSNTLIDRAADAISQLDGVSVCNIYFNYLSSSSTIVNGITVPPRQSLIFVQGFSADIAKTYWAYLDIKCAGEDAASSVEQVYTTRAGQSLPVYIIPPQLIDVGIRVYFNEVIEDVVAQEMKDVIATLARARTIGQVLTSTEVVDVLQANFSYAPAGCSLSLDYDTYSYQVKPEQYQLVTFSNKTIEIIGASA